MISTPSSHITCLCGTISEPGSLLEHPEFPIPAVICHCNVCRYTTGSMGASFPHLKSSPSESTISKLIGYRSSENITRYFCASCGSHCFMFHQPRNKWFCLGGVIELDKSLEKNEVAKPENTVEVKLHEYVSDAIDGGLAYMCSKLGSRDIPAWTAEPGSSPISKEEIQSLFENSAKILPQPGKENYLPAKCHCGGVSLLIKQTSFKSQPPARFLPSDSTKWLSYMCACRSCRLSFGVSLTPWTLVLPGNIFNAIGPQEGSLNPITFGRQASKSDVNVALSLKHYWSSPHVCRSFCGKCGASVSYWNEKRPGECDMASGIFRAEEGSMGRRWLEWWGRCSFAEDGIDQETVDAWLGCEDLVNRLDTR